MTFKKKTIISLFTVATTFVLAIVGVVGILAISNVSLKTSINMTYTSTVVGASYNMLFKNSTDTEYTYIDNNVWLSSEGENPVYQTSSISSDTFELNADNRYCVLCWQFTNTGIMPYTVTLSYEDDINSANDINEDRGVTLLKHERALMLSATTDTSGDAAINESLSLGNQTYFTGTTIEVGKTRYFFIKITLNTNIAYCEYSGNFNWTLTAVQTTE